MRLHSFKHVTCHCFNFKLLDRIFQSEKCKNKISYCEFVCLFAYTVAFPPPIFLYVLSLLPLFPFFLYHVFYTLFSTET